MAGIVAGSKARNGMAGEGQLRRKTAPQTGPRRGRQQGATGRFHPLHEQMAWRLQGSDRYQPGGPPGRTHGHLRPLRFGEIHPDPLHQPPGGASGGHHHRRWHHPDAGDEERRGSAPRCGHGVSVVQPVCASHGAGKLRPPRCGAPAPAPGRSGCPAPSARSCSTCLRPAATAIPAIARSRKKRNSNIAPPLQDLAKEAADGLVLRVRASPSRATMPPKSRLRSSTSSRIT